MSWRERLKIASFRGIEFFIDSRETVVGRRTAVHTFPDRDINFVEDIGRATREFSFDGFLIGEDYDIVRDQLIAELEKPGPGPLSHPSFGIIQVQSVRTARIRENSKDGGMAIVTMVFMESEPPFFLERQR